MESLKNLLMFLNDNLTAIVIIIGTGLGLYKKIKNYLCKSTEEKIAIAKKLIIEQIKLYMVDAEENYQDYIKAGSVKRAEVLGNLYKDYPILAKVVNQEELFAWIDELINDSLEEVEKIVK